MLWTPALFLRVSPHLLVVLIILGSISPAMAGKEDLRMVVTAAFVSEKGMPVYQEIAQYLSGKIKRDIKLVSGTSYDESDKLLKQGVIQIGFVCGLPYTHNFAKNNYRLLAIPVMAMKKGSYPDVPGYEDVPGKYFSYTLVRKDSPLKSWQDLRGHSYTYNDQNSNSGYNMPRYKLVQLGAKKWEDWFSKVAVSGSHEQSIRMVARGVVDASSVDSLVLDYDRSIGDPDALNVRVIEVLGYPKGAGIVPVVYSSRADPKLGEMLQNVLLGMHQDPDGQRILKKAMILRFNPPDDSNYDDVRRMEKAAISAGFKDHQP